mgnify:CR=1 FL=1
MDPSAPARMHTTGAPHEAHGTAWLADCKCNGRPHEHSSRSYRHMSPVPRTAHPAHGSGEFWGSGCGSRPGFGCKLGINILPKGMHGVPGAHGTPNEVVRAGSCGVRNTEITHYTQSWCVYTSFNGTESARQDAHDRCTPSGTCNGLARRLHAKCSKSEP